MQFTWLHSLLRIVVKRCKILTKFYTGVYNLLWIVTQGCKTFYELLHRTVQLVTNFCTELYSLLQIFAQSYTISYELLHRGVRLVISCAQGSTPTSVQQHLSLGSHSFSVKKYYGVYNSQHFLSIRIKLIQPTPFHFIY